MCVMLACECWTKIVVQIGRFYFILFKKRREMLSFQYVHQNVFHNTSRLKRYGRWLAISVSQKLLYCMKADLVCLEVQSEILNY